MKSNYSKNVYSTKNPMTGETDFTNISIPEPSAPVAAAEVYYGSARVVEPFSIAMGEATPLKYEGSYESEFTSPDVQGRRSSTDIDRAIARTYHDGERILREEQYGATKSVQQGVQVSSYVDRQVQQSNRDRVDSLEIKSIPTVTGFDITASKDFRYDATKDVVKKDPKTAQGYAMNEYRSVYETSTPSGEYVMSEYKSIYE